MTILGMRNFFFTKTSFLKIHFKLMPFFLLHFPFYRPFFVCLERKY